VVTPTNGMILPVSEYLVNLLRAREDVSDMENAGVKLVAAPRRERLSRRRFFDIFARLTYNYCTFL
jgi:hypothetical protein